MKNLVLFIALLSFTFGFSQEKKKQVVEAAWVRIDGKSYFVEGTKIDEHGDAHADDGFCNAIKKAEVIGEVKDGKFVVSYFKLLPNSTKK